MNQHASRPVAQGFPLHRRMNGPIQSSSSSGGGPSRSSTPLRPSNPSSVMTNALRRSLGFNSQIPTRIGFGDHHSSSSQQASLRARVLERHRQSLVVNSTSLPQAMRTSSASSASLSSSTTSQLQPIDNAFKVYEDRLQSDFRDFHAMCTRLILQEIEEKEKWHNLCLKMMKERDAARQRISVLISERESHLSSSSSAALPASPAAQEKNVTSKASKRGRDESASSAAAQEQLPSRSSPVESRPIRGLRLSPIPSPSRSPSAASLNSSTPPSGSSYLPSTTSQSPPSPSSSNVNTVLTDSTSSSSVPPPLNIMTFNPPRSPDDTTCFDVFGEFDIPESRPVKRRKSYDSDEPLPFLIAHTDIMYIPMKGRLYCRACLLDKTTNPSKNRNPKTFPTNVNWNELRDHCVTEHFTACQDVARLSPADLNELRRRLYK